NWSGYKKPFISKVLNEVLRLPEEPSSLWKIEERIKDQSYTLREIEK
ncbi:18225_t:CDS:1, partial [Gigaspora rosea]